MYSARSANWTCGSRLRRVWPLCLAGLAAAGASGAVQPLDVRLSGPELLSVAPGQVLSVTALVTNLTAQDAEVVESLTTPPSWQALTKPASFILAAGQTRARLLAITVPRQAGAGAHTITYGARLRSAQDAGSETSLRVQVADHRQLEILLEDRALTAVAGQPLEVQAVVHNQGNCPLDIKLSADLGPKSTLTVQPSELELGPGAQVAVTVTGTLDIGTAEGQALLRIQALGRVDATLQTLGQTSAVVRLLRPSVNTLDLERRLPARLTVRGGGSRGGSGMQFELAGGGSLDDAAQERVDFLLRGPDLSEATLFGQEDQCHLRYESALFDAALGDQVCGLSPLTRPSAYSRGLSVRYRPDAETTALVYLARTRGFAGSQRQLGARVERQFGGARWIAASFLGETATGIPRTASGETCSLEANLPLHSALRFRAELAVGRNGEGRHGDAYRLEAHGTWRAASYRLIREHASPEFTGHRRDVDRMARALNIAVGPRLRVQLAASEYSRNLAADPSRTSAPSESRRSWGLTFSPEPSWSVELGGDEFQSVDRLSRQDTRETAVRFAVGHADPKATVRMEYRRGRRETEYDATSSVWQVTGLALYRPRPECAVSLFAGLGDTTSRRGSWLVGGGNNLGLAVDWRPDDRWDYSLWLVRQSDLGRNDRLMRGQLTASYRTSSGQSWGLQMQRSGYGSGRVDTDFLASYTLPFSLPLGRRQDVGAVQGRLIDTEASEGRGVGGARVQVGGKAVVTGPDGSFALSGLAPGDYPVAVDRASIGLQRVLSQTSARAVKVVGGQVTSLCLSVARAATLRGQLTLAAHPAPVTVIDGVMGPSGPVSLRGVLIELTNGVERQRAFSDADGEVCFAGLAAGSWRLKVDSRTLPAYHVVVGPEISLELAPGEERDVRFALQPQLRQIRMVPLPGLERLQATY